MINPIDLYFFFDFDGSLGARLSTKLDTMFKANPLLNAYIQALKNDPNIKRMTVVNLSLRNDPKTDRHCAIRNDNGSVFHRLQEYTAALNIFLDKMVLQDFVLEKEPGWTWNKLETLKWAHLNEHFNKEHRLMKEPWMGDDTKIILFFLHAWYCHQKRLPGCQLRIPIFDDRKDILDALHFFCENNKDILPPHMHVEFFQYLHEVDEYGEDIQYIFKKHAEDVTTSPSQPVATFDIFEAAQNLKVLLRVLSFNGYHLAQNFVTDLTLEDIAPDVTYGEPLVPPEHQDSEQESTLVSQTSSCCEAMLQFFYQKFGSRLTADQGKSSEMNAPLLGPNRH